MMMASIHSALKPTPFELWEIFRNIIIHSSKLYDYHNLYAVILFWDKVALLVGFISSSNNELSHFNE